MIWKHPHGRGEDHGIDRDQHFAVETPPRAWGRLWIEFNPESIIRNTPTGVGKTLPILLPCLSPWKHPHGRGEDLCDTPRRLQSIETPPRAWGRRLEREPKYKVSRNTPTGVGKTRFESDPDHRAGKHPHGRGEDQKLCGGMVSKSETPPRAWGRPVVVIVP